MTTTLAMYKHAMFLGRFIYGYHRNDVITPRDIFSLGKNKFIISCPIRLFQKDTTTS